MSRVVIVTGVARFLGMRVARILAGDPEVDRVVGVDVIPPQGDLGRAEFVRADIRYPIIAKIISRYDVDTVVHMNVLATPVGLGGRLPQKDINVIGTMQLLAACQKSPTVRKLVVKSSTTVYGASPSDPAMFTEDMDPKAMPRSGFGKDSVEVEGYVRGFSRRRPDVIVTTFRFANFIGPLVRTPFTEYFTLPVVPSVLGHDARLQFVHEDDGMEALRLASVHDRPGTFNVSGDGVLMLSQAIRRTGRPSLPVPAFGASVVGGWFRRARIVDFSPEQIRFLRYGRGVDTTRVKRLFGFTPTRTTAEAFDHFVHARCAGALLDPDRLAHAERHLVALLGAGRPPMAQEAASG